MTTAYRFGRFELQPDKRQLQADGRAVALGQRAFDVLHALIARHERLVAKNELLDLVWPGLVVEENNVQVQISALRKVLGPQVIATIPGRGYRFTAALDGAAGRDPATSAAGPIPGAKTGAPAARLTNLPAELPLLYGRDADLTALRSLIDAHRLVTVVGAGGIGKSRLAQAVARAAAHRWSDGAWMIELAGLSDPRLVPAAVAQVLDIKLAGLGAAIDELVTGMALRTALLVLDNCEHLLDAVATLAQAIARGAPGVTVLSTSQEPLRLPSEQQYRVAPLPVPSSTAESAARGFGAVALFEARARAADPRFTLHDEALALVIDICLRLDGLPLAIELAAARAATLGLRPVRDKLDARFKLLTGGSRAVLRRHQTLHAALEWSYHLLTEAEQAVFRRLGVFAGGFTIELAQAVAGDAQRDEWAVLDILSALVDKSLVVTDADDTPRYRLLESTRAFALEQLAAGETADTLKRHARAMRDFLQRVDDRHLDGEMLTEQLRALLLPERDNVRAARAWAIGEQGDIEVAVVLAECVNALEDYALESVDWLLALRQQVEAGGVSPVVAARYWRALASANTTLTDRAPRALQSEAADRARSLYQALGHPRRAFSSLVLLANHLSALDQGDAAQAVADEARRLMRPEWPAMLRVRLLRLDAWLAARSGKLTEALALHRDAVRLSVSTGDWLLEVMARENVVELLWEIGPIDDAAREIRGLVTELRARPLTALDMAGTFTQAIGVLSEMGCIDEASAVALEALPLMQRARSHYIEEWTHLFWRRGDIGVSVGLLGASDARRARQGVALRPNQQRLIAEVRAALQSQLDPDAFATGFAAGAALADSEMIALISECLAQTRGSQP